MNKASFNRIPYMLRARVNVSQVDIRHSRHASALLAFDGYQRAFPQLMSECEIILFHYGEPVKHWQKEAGTSMGKLAEIYQANSDLAPFLSTEQKELLIDKELQFNITAIRDTVSNMTGNQQFTITLEIFSDLELFKDVRYAFSLTSDKARAAAMQVMREDIEALGYYGPCILNRSGRYYRIEDAL